MDGDDLWKVEERVPYLGHLDIIYPADMIEELPGKEVFYCREGWDKESENIGMLLVDQNGKTIWGNWGYTHVDGGWAAKVIPDSDEWQMFGFDVQRKDWTPGHHKYKNPLQHFFDSKGKLIAHPDSTWIRSFTVDWEGDGIKEICTKAGEIKRYNNEVITKLGEGIAWGGDILGDHREELIITPNDGKIYIVFNTTERNTDPQITKVADRQYKNDLSRTGMQTNVIPTESGFIPSLKSN